ncbi:phytanoyl-CoA dioxygenase family protein [Synechococcus sp. Cruz-9H2]|uniref:phytanoyl-CoA dioxygenase family protein n=1 Tax=unclassified Synechococcus TaxID=2626047 RepID=UPI0020CE763A|nr:MULTISPECIES: phytanoyl-CoA dioxygenase family protein [unclassified Synechococcus]MCP9820357.1 phytanoyl-CoA dioxygenase family protein [Synechococcus sp. Cruz-9H2]MCP9844665.1 phytanoyl-CoA dioxygenase family protein [Synechococcus sp. Edmonson 11F2]MCP9856787.1 phytanoyl-CoA dioxygenase family protein [Synechococcus sp. Cruz-9C9]MCP9864003.1 phytanoyl-CoA dioxygenase family protein [Synechococcus sp. Cruz-7E5]MCP9871198.1 phytanoyl-CoA dioxygenase family protein [Synechococcus sp. Cruz-7
MSKASAKEYQECGYVVVRGLFGSQEIKALRACLDIAQTRKPGEDWLTKDKMVFRSNLFQRSTALQAFISQPRIVDLVSTLIGPDFWVRWDQMVNKLPGGGEFPWHQDNAYNNLLTAHCQLWVALTPINLDMGGFWVQPGSHRQGLLQHRFIDRYAVFAGEVMNPVLIEAEAGDVILFSSYLLHSTSVNISQHERCAYVVEFVPSRDIDPYIRSPYFRVALHGRPAPRFQSFLPSHFSLRNQLLYLGPRLARVARRMIQASQSLGISQ